MEKIKARYLAPLEETASKVASIQTKDLAFAYTTLSEAEEKSVKAEMEQYLLMASCCAEYEYDDDDGPSRYYSTKTFDLDELTSLSSPMYSTDIPCADILVSGGSFRGLILKGRRWGGNGWNNYDERWYMILYVDGTIVGDNVSSYSFSGSSSSKEEDTVYTLIEKI